MLMNSPGDRLRMLRARVDFSQREMAAVLGCSHNWIHFVEREKYQPKPDFFEKVHEIFGIHLNSTNFFNDLANVNIPEVPLPEAA